MVGSNVHYIKFVVNWVKFSQAQVQSFKALEDEKMPRHILFNYSGTGMSVQHTHSEIAVYVHQHCI